MTWNTRREGNWKDVALFARRNGEWRDVQRGYVKEDDKWKQNYDSKLTIKLTEDENEVEIDDKLREKYVGMSARNSFDLDVIVEQDVEIGATLSFSGKYSYGSVTLTIEEGAVVAGRGGKGGSVLGVKDQGDSGSGIKTSASRTGGDAIYTDVSITINNRGHLIAGGGGGGWAYVVSSSGPLSSLGSVAFSGGGGAGIPGGSAGSVSDEWGHRYLGKRGSSSEGGRGEHGSGGMYSGDGGDVGKEGSDGSDEEYHGIARKSDAGKGSSGGKVVGGSGKVTWRKKGKQN